MTRAQIQQLHEALCGLLGCGRNDLHLTQTPEDLMALTLRGRSTQSLTRVGSAEELLHWAQEHRSTITHPRAIIKRKAHQAGE